MLRRAHGGCAGRLATFVMPHASILTPPLSGGRRLLWQQLIRDSLPLRGNPSLPRREALIVLGELRHSARERLTEFAGTVTPCNVEDLASRDSVTANLQLMRYTLINSCSPSSRTVTVCGGEEWCERGVRQTSYPHLESLRLQTNVSSHRGVVGFDVVRVSLG